MALNLYSRKGHSRAYPDTAELLDFGRRVCGVADPAAVLRRIAQALHKTLRASRSDSRIPASLLADMARVWSEGMIHGRYGGQ